MYSSPADRYIAIFIWCFKDIIKVQFACLGLVEEIEPVYCRCMRNWGNKDPHGLWLDRYPQGTSLPAQDSLPSLAVPGPHNQSAPRVLQDWKTLEKMGQALCWCTFSVFRVITAHTMQISALCYLTGSRTGPGFSFSLGVLCWQCKPNLLFNNKWLYALFLSSLMLLLVNLFVRFGVRCKYPLICSNKQ